MKTFTLKLIMAIGVILSLTACGEESSQDTAVDEARPEAAMEQTAPEQPTAPPRRDTAAAPKPVTDFSEAVAVIHPTKGNEASGHVTLSRTTEGIRVQAQISGLSEGLHGFHIHEFGDCRAADGTSAGGHYGPDEGSKHGAPDDPDSHDGDLGNIEADPDGNASLDIASDDITLNGPKSVIGRGIVIHGGEDDLESQPSGAAGPRLACGVIGIANTGE